MGNKQTYDKNKLQNLSQLLEPKNYNQLESPKKGEWLYHIKERGQTIDQYISNHHMEPDDTRNKIYIMQLSQLNINIDKLVEYISIFFNWKPF